MYLHTVPFPIDVVFKKYIPTKTAVWYSQCLLCNRPLPRVLPVVHSQRRLNAPHQLPSRSPNRPNPIANQDERHVLLVPKILPPQRLWEVLIFILQMSLLSIAVVAVLCLLCRIRSMRKRLISTDRKNRWWFHQYILRAIIVCLLDSCLCLFLPSLLRWKTTIDPVQSQFFLLLSHSPTSHPQGLWYQLENDRSWPLRKGHNISICFLLERDYQVIDAFYGILFCLLLFESSCCLWWIPCCFSMLIVLNNILIVWFEF